MAKSLVFVMYCDKLQFIPAWFVAVWVASHSFTTVGVGFVTSSVLHEEKRIIVESAAMNIVLKCIIFMFMFFYFPKVLDFQTIEMQDLMNGYFYLMQKIFGEHILLCRAKIKC